jgi:hypothetical protein
MQKLPVSSALGGPWLAKRKLETFPVKMYNANVANIWPHMG